MSMERGRLEAVGRRSGFGAYSLPFGPELMAEGQPAVYGLSG